MGREYARGDPNRVENNRAVQVPKQTLGQPPHMLMTGMPRNPNTRHVEVRMGGSSDAEKKQIRAALEHGLDESLRAQQGEARRFLAKDWIPVECGASRFRR